MNLKLRPSGKPVLFGVMDNGKREQSQRGVASGHGVARKTFVLGLPGNPVSVLTTAMAPPWSRSPQREPVGA